MVRDRVVVGTRTDYERHDLGTMATLTSSIIETTIHAGVLRIIYQHTDDLGVVYGPSVTHAPIGTDTTQLMESYKASMIASLAAAEITANVNQSLEAG